MGFSAYLDGDQDLSKGCVDDYGDGRYLRLDQNVPDGYVHDLQTDLFRMGFTVLGEPDGAFGNDTRKAVVQFQELAGLVANGIVDRVTKSELRIWLKHGYTKDRPPAPRDESPPPADGGLTLIAPRVPHFSQGDPRWAGRLLGKRSTIAKQGCAVASIAMILNFFGRHVTPGTLDEHLDREDGYRGDSVRWNVAGRCGEAPGNVLRYASMDSAEDELHARLIERIRRNLPTMVRVDYGVDRDIQYNHFVVCVGMTDRGHLVMNDPATRLGDGYADPGRENVIEETTRKGGYRVVRLDWYDHVA